MFERLKVKIYRFWFERAYGIKRWNPVLGAFLWVISALYSILGILRYYFGSLFAYSPSRLKVISVGSPFSGGTGKTLFATFLTSYLRKKGLRAIYIFKPYRRGRKVYNLDEYEEVRSLLGEEVLLPQSLKGCIKELDEGGEFDVAVLDDALTHPFVKKTADILMIDLDRANVRGVIPYGPLRTPFFKSSGLKVFKVIKGVNNGVCMRVMPVSLYDLKRGEDLPLSKLSLGKWVAFAGTGDPFSFFKLIEELNCSVVRFFVFPDHHFYTERDIDEIRSIDGFYITTGKDSFRLKRFIDLFPTLFVLKVNTEVCGIEHLDEYLRKSGVPI